MKGLWRGVLARRLAERLLTERTSHVFLAGELGWQTVGQQRAVDDLTAKVAEATFAQHLADVAEVGKDRHMSLEDFLDETVPPVEEVPIAKLSKHQRRNLRKKEERVERNFLDAEAAKGLAEKQCRIASWERAFERELEDYLPKEFLWTIKVSAGDEDGAFYTAALHALSPHTVAEAETLEKDISRRLSTAFGDLFELTFHWQPCV